MNYYLIGLGSNIHGDINLPKAQIIISHTYEVVAYSQVLINPACGGTLRSPFHNQLLLVKSSQTCEEMKAAFEQVEIQLGREEKSPERKFKDRTIDIDILCQAQTAKDALTAPVEDVYNQQIMKDWSHATLRE